MATTAIHPPEKCQQEGQEGEGQSPRQSLISTLIRKDGNNSNNNNDNDKPRPPTIALPVSVTSGDDVERLNEEQRERDDKAARTIQRVYRGHAARLHVQHLRLKTDARWDDLVKHNEEIMYSRGQLDNQNDVKSRWHRAAQAAARLQKGEGLYTSPDSLLHTTLTSEIDPASLTHKERKARRATFWGSLSMGIGKERDEKKELGFQSKALEQQHWLEMIDGKHRYGSNMKYYFRRWKEADTSDNFFRWLDRGEGKGLDLEEMPRERLESERIAYLTAEQRLNYLVKVDKDGLLRWVRNNELVDTAAGKWKDSEAGQGIVPADESEDEGDQSLPTVDPYAAPHARRQLHPKSKKTNASSSSSSVSSFSSDSYSAQSSDLDENEDTHYLALDKRSDNRLTRGRKKITPGGVRKELLRKTVRRNTWIYVSDMRLNLFVGIKKSGTFQHSSFLAGGKVTSAGLIVVKHGLVKSLNPLSGHYRSQIENFRWFIAELENKGIDLSHVKIAKSVLSLWGLSKYAKFTKAQQRLLTHMARTLHLSHQATEAEKSEELRKNAEREEMEHQERMKKVQEAEDDVRRKSAAAAGEGREGEVDKEQGEVDKEQEEAIRRARREVLYGRRQDEQTKKEDTEKELRPV